MSRVADRKVAKRYASALFGAARRSGATDAINKDLAALKSFWAQEPKVRSALESPLVPSERKRRLIEVAFGDLDRLTRAFLHLLVEKRREAILGLVGEEFARLADEARGLVRASATVASPLDELQRAAMVEALERRTGKQIELTLAVDESLIGGAVVRMQDTILDGSVRGALERLRNQMLREL